MRVSRAFALAFSLVICSLFAFYSAHAQISIGISVDVEPPPLPVYDQPPIPAPGYLWVPGYWAWDDDTGYYWVPGTWVTPPEPELLWTPGYWGWDDGAYQFHDGYWGPQIGFYGGVAYGFGYTGDGYEGGQWRNGIFFYNQSVNNISNVSITNVYNKTVVVNNTSNVSYNGGTGGTAAKPTPEQLAAGKEHHLVATPEQTRHVEAAAKDPALSLNSNHGHPTVAATAHPALFKGPGIIAAHPGKPIAGVTPEGHRKTPSNPAALPGNKVGPGNAATGPGNKVVPGSAPAGPGNAAISRDNKPGREMREHKAKAGGAATPGAGNTVSPEIKEHKGNANGGPPPGTGSTTQTKLPTNAVHAPAAQIARPSPPPPPRAAAPPPPRAAAPPPPPAPRVAAPAPPRPAPPPPRPAAPAAKPKCQPGQHC